MSNTQTQKGKKCGQTTEVYSRVCGYHRPVHQSWNEGKKEEFKQRKTFKIASKGN